MNVQTTLDSRQYRYSYWLRAASDVPGDFSIPPLTHGWLSAIFIPGDTEAFWNTPEYPPRVYIFTRDALMVYSHSSANEAPFVVPLKELIEIDTERALLYGVVEFYADGSSHRFRYNTRHRNHLSAFLRALRSVWLPQHGISLPASSFSLTTRGMTFRCWYALRAELDPDEILYGVCCQPPIRPEKKGWFHKTAQALPAVLLAVTNHRLIAISTGTGETDDLYGIAVRYAATCNLKATAVSSSVNGLILSLKLKNGRDWQFPFEEDRTASLASFQHILARLEPILQERATGSLPPQEVI
jgi:hypothetical protein